MALLLGGGPKAGPMDDAGESPEDAEEPALDTAVKDLHDSMKAGDMMGMKDALKAFFYQMDSQPHQEGPDEAGDGQ